MILFIRALANLDLSIPTFPLYNTRMARCYLFFLCLLLLAFATPVFADAGTPLMWLEFGHLVFLNLFIGIVEGLIIALLFKARVLRSMGIMILANYFSAWVGSQTLLRYSDQLSRLVSGQVTLYNAPAYLIIMAVLAFAVTVFLEWPFCFWILRSHLARLSRSFCASLLVQCISYAFLFYIYLHGSSLGVFQSVSIDVNLVPPQPAQYWVYYLDPKGFVCRMHPDGSQMKSLNVSVDVNSFGFLPPRLYAFKQPENDYYDLWAMDLGRSEKPKKLVTNFTRHAVFAHPPGDPNTLFSEPNQVMFRSFAVVDLRQQDSNSTWSADAPTDWAWWGLFCRDHVQNRGYRVAFETPFLVWNSSAVNMLPGNFVVYQLGPQIVLLDMPNHKIRLLTLGSAPLVAPSD
jgi:hypothetical protein